MLALATSIERSKGDVSPTPPHLHALVRSIEVTNTR
jgi:hypothetical protein